MIQPRRGAMPDVRPAKNTETSHDYLKPSTFLKKLSYTTNFNALTFLAMKRSDKPFKTPLDPTFFNLPT